MSDAPFEAPSIESIAALFPAFEFDHLIAQGGMGAVYLARQRSLDRDVAIKILPRELGQDPLFRKSFVAEAKAMATVVHPNLITVHDSGDVDGLLYIIMEYVSGKSLHRSAHQKAVDPQQSVEIILGICRGLAEAHHHGIVHRDIKPGNILLTQKRQPKIGDFGLARPAGHDIEGLAMGTPGYSAPEVARHPELADHRSDIFAVGVMLRELLTGRPPENDPQPERGIRDRKLLEICRKATAKDPSQRYQKAEAMIADLKSWLHQPDEPLAPPAEAAPAKRTPIVDRSASSALGRNIALIIVLLAAIYGTWTLLQKKKAVTAAMVEKSAPAKPRPPQPVQQEPAATVWPEPIRPAVSDVPEPLPAAEDRVSTGEPPEAATETPAQSLIRLRAALTAGEFSELPIGTLTHGSSHYFFVPRAASWRQASLMARSFGGHLAILSDEVLRTWLASAIPEDRTHDPAKQAIWIGATRTSPELWQLVNAVPWPLDTVPAGDGDFAALQRDALVMAESESATHPFFIQWHRDGSKPTSIEQILTRCKQSQESDQPFFPPGIEKLGERSFLVVREAFNYDEASRLAEIGGGHLMTVATQEEADFLDKLAGNTNAANGLWLGATLRDGFWTWDSREPWTFARWAPSSQPKTGEALIFQPRAGWAEADPGQEASGFIIEWSHDHQNAETPPTRPKLLADMDAKAKNVLAGLDTRRQDALNENSDEYLWKLDIWLRRRGNNHEIQTWTPHVKTVKATVKGGRLPADIPRTPGGIYAAPLLEIARHYFIKQQAIDHEFTTKATGIRDAYVARLSEEAREAEQLGQRENALLITEKATEAADIKTWIESFGFINH
ncbi:protein kinase [Haloferula chungangensis]|uniref:Protein kinase n=1 Tax=Haloferula chungangensis TaxID=1048331 RepID=A0ABW2L8W2_9BACT